MHPDPAGQLLVVAEHELALEHIDDRVHEGRRVLERRSLARLADEAARERALGHDAGQGAVPVDDRNDLEVSASHRPPCLADRFVLADDREARLHHIAGSEHHMRDELRLACAAALEHPARLRVALSEPDRDVVVVGVQPALELGVADRRGDRVGVRVAMAGDVDQRHADDYRRWQGSRAPHKLTELWETRRPGALASGQLSHSSPEAPGMWQTVGGLATGQAPDFIQLGLWRVVLAVDHETVQDPQAEYEDRERPPRMCSAD